MQSKKSVIYLLNNCAYYIAILSISVSEQKLRCHINILMDVATRSRFRTIQLQVMVQLLLPAWLIMHV